MDEVGGLARATDVAKQLAGLSLDPSASITQEWPPRWVLVQQQKHAIVALVFCVCGNMCQ